jgi:hypothetical protein
MPDGGRLTIETRNVQLDVDYARLRIDVEAGEYVAISVSDTGVGMSPNVVERAFDPFFTTKPIGLGTGLGLSMIYGFAKQSRGHVRICSQEGHGTTVRLYLARAYMDLDPPPRRLQPSSGHRAVKAKSSWLLRTTRRCACWSRRCWRNSDIAILRHQVRRRR